MKLDSDLHKLIKSDIPLFKENEFLNVRDEQKI